MSSLRLLLTVISCSLFVEARSEDLQWVAVEPAKMRSQPRSEPNSGVNAEPSNETRLRLTAVSQVEHKAAPTTPQAGEPATCRRCVKETCHGVCRAAGHPQKPCFTKPGDRNRTDRPAKRYLMPDGVRAGNPHQVAPWAKCGIDSKYSAWFVGGGTPFAKGRPRKSTEGTWGTDYSGLFGHAKVWLKYTRLNRSQGGEGAYATDGEPAFVKHLHEKFHH